MVASDEGSGDLSAFLDLGPTLALRLCTSRSEDHAAQAYLNGKASIIYPLPFNALA